ESRFRALVLAGSYAVYRMSPDWREMHHLEGAHFLTDTPKPGAGWLDTCIDPSERPRAIVAIEDAIRRKGTFELEHRVGRADGSLGWALLRAVPIIDRRGEIMEWFGAAFDITDRREAEARLRELNETLESRVAERTNELLQAEVALRQAQKMEAVGQLTGGVAHDFNNLLTIIRSSVDLLRRANLSEDRRKRYIDAISDTVDRASKLTGQLLAFARRQALKPEVVDVVARLRSITGMIDTVTGARVKVVSDVPDRPCVVKVDASQFDTALVNIAVNARDAMDGEGTLTLKLTSGVPMPPIHGHSKAPGRFAKIELSDTGTGIAADNLERIFEPFFTTKETGKGTGLGLSQVFGFAKQSGGDVDVVSKLGQGATFTLYLPETDAKPDQTMGEAAHSLAPAGDGRRMLIVEENVDVGQFAEQILKDLGYRPTWVTNAETALEELGEDGGAFDAVFSDVVMQGIGGMALAKILRDRFPGLQVILTSGYSDVLAHTGSQGFELLHKPYSADQLARVLRS
ncbi:MAG: response regulator, partial [Alphaproteobacteria bacterium]|nr:response regulator [Alphaproteobacteria bacterium]